MDKQGVVVRVIIDIFEEVDEEDLDCFMQNLEAETWFDSKIRKELT